MKSVKHLLSIFSSFGGKFGSCLRTYSSNGSQIAHRKLPKVLTRRNQILAQNAFRSMFFQQETTKNGISRITFIKQNSRLVAAN